MHSNSNFLLKCVKTKSWGETSRETAPVWHRNLPWTDKTMSHCGLGSDILAEYMLSVNTTISWCIIWKSKLVSLPLLILKVTLCYSKQYCHFDLHDDPPVGK